MKKLLLLLMFLMLFTTSCKKENEQLAVKPEENILEELEDKNEEKEEKEEDNTLGQEEIEEFRKLLESTIWVGESEVEFSGSYLSIKFANGSVEHGFYSSEIELVEGYEIKSLESNTGNLSLEESGNAIVTLDGKDRLTIFMEDRNQAFEYISEEKWLEGAEE